MPADWTREEVEAVVADYLQMLDLELRGQGFSKTEHRQALLPLLNHRTGPSVEFKHANISAILIEIGFPYISGYKPRGNYQQLLKDVVEDRLRSSEAIIRLAATDADSMPVLPSYDDILAALTRPPRPTAVNDSRPPRRPYPIRPNPLATNYLEREARNRELGRAGELFTVAYEQARLTAAGKDRLAANIEHVALTRGDGLGYDVLSFNDNGSERFIEVKTTKYGAQTPFFLTRNEVELSTESAAQFHLYRIYDFRRDRRFFALPGSLRKSCHLVAESYIGRVA